MNEKERVAEIITNSLTEEFEVSEVNNVQYLHGAPQSETEFTATIKSKSDSDFVGYIWIDFQDGFQNEANVEFCKNILINFQKVFIEGKNTINKMKQATYDLYFMYAYCFGEKFRVIDFNDLNNLIDCYQYDGNHYRFDIDINDSNIWINNCLKLKEDKVILNIKVHATTEKKLIMYTADNIQEQEKFKRNFLNEFAAIPLNKGLEELKSEDYKLLHMINY